MLSFDHFLYLFVLRIPKSRLNLVLFERLTPPPCKSLAEKTNALLVEMFNLFALLKFIPEVIFLDGK